MIATWWSLGEHIFEDGILAAVVHVIDDTVDVERRVAYHLVVYYMFLLEGSFLKIDLCYRVIGRCAAWFNYEKRLFIPTCAYYYWRYGV